MGGTQGEQAQAAAQDNKDGLGAVKNIDFITLP